MFKILVLLLRVAVFTLVICGSRAAAQHKTAVYNNIVYILINNKIERYDLATESWLEKITTFTSGNNYDDYLCVDGDGILLASKRTFMQYNHNGIVKNSFPGVFSGGSIPTYFKYGTFLLEFNRDKVINGYEVLNGQHVKAYNLNKGNEVTESPLTIVVNKIVHEESSNRLFLLSGSSYEYYGIATATLDQNGVVTMGTPTLHDNSIPGWDHLQMSLPLTNVWKDKYRKSIHLGHSLEFFTEDKTIKETFHATTATESPNDNYMYALNVDNQMLVLDQNRKLVNVHILDQAADFIHYHNDHIYFFDLKITTNHPSPTVTKKGKDSLLNLAQSEIPENYTHPKDFKPLNVNSQGIHYRYDVAKNLILRWDTSAHAYLAPLPLPKGAKDPYCDTANARIYFSFSSGGVAYLDTADNSIHFIALLHKNAVVIGIIDSSKIICRTNAESAAGRLFVVDVYGNTTRSKIDRYNDNLFASYYFLPTIAEWIPNANAIIAFTESLYETSLKYAYYNQSPEQFRNLLSGELSPIYNDQYESTKSYAYPSKTTKSYAISPDKSKFIYRDGRLYNTSDCSYAAQSIPTSFDHVLWIDEKIITSKQLSSSLEIAQWDNALQMVKKNIFPGFLIDMEQLPNGNILIVRKTIDNKIQNEIYDTNLNVLPPTEFETPSIALVESGNNSINLTWSDVASEAAYTIQRRTLESNQWITISEAGKDAVDFTYSEVPVNTISEYRIYAHNGDVQSAYSNIVFIDTRFPSNQLQLITQQVKSNSIIISWTQPERASTVHLRWRESNLTEWQEEKIVPIQDPYEIILLKSGVEYTIEAFGISNRYGTTEIFSSLTHTTIPTVARSFQASVMNQRKVKLNWLDAKGENYYRLDKRIGDAEWQTLASLPQNSISYEDASIIPNVTYQYRLSAINQGGAATTNGITIATTPNQRGSAGAMTTLTPQSNSETLNPVENLSNTVGTYVGNVRDYMGDVTGSFTSFKINSTGSFSASFQIANRKSSFKGKLSPGGYYQFIDKDNNSVELQLCVHPRGHKVMKGRFLVDYAEYVFDLVRPVTNTNLAGSYTGAGKYSVNAYASHMAYGVMTMQIAKDGKITIMGRNPEAFKTTASTYLREDLTFECFTGKTTKWSKVGNFYASYAGVFEEVANVCDFHGKIDIYFEEGLSYGKSSSLDMIGSRYTYIKGRNPINLSTSPWHAHLLQYRFNGSHQETTFTVLPDGVITNNAMQMSINPKTGEYKAKILVYGVNVLFDGVIIQKQQKIIGVNAAVDSFHILDVEELWNPLQGN